jgi:ligand-binding sensor domain-containing protein/signal transduction histidine kinase
MILLCNMPHPASPVRARCELAFLLTISLCAVPLLALDPSRRVTQYMVDSLEREDGLPQSSVQSIVQTRDGYLWFGTEQGLSRYNGARMATFGNWNTPEIIGNDTQVLFEDRSGALWMGSHGHGVARLQAGRFTRVAARLSSQFVFSITQDTAGGMWIGTDDGLNQLIGDRVRSYTTKEGLADQTVYAVLAARDGSIWAGTKRGLTHLRDGTLRTYTTRDGLPSDSVRSLREDRAGALWIGTLGGGVARLENGTFTTIGAREGLPNLDVFSILEDRDGSVWIGTGGGGLARFRDGRISVLTTEGGLASNTVLSLLEDAEGNLWIGTDGGGVTQLRDSKFVTLGKADGLSHDVVLSTFEDAVGDIWLGTYGGGVNRLSGDSIRVYNTANGLSNDAVFAVGGDRTGNIWIGTYDGLNRLQGDRLSVYRVKDGLPSSSVSVIYEDRAGNVWFGTPDGVSRFRDERFTTFTAANGLPHSWVLAVLEDRRGQLWFGTAAGLARFDGRTFKTLGPKDGLADALVMGLHEDDDGVLWVATQKGLSRIADGKVTTYTRRIGLFDDLVLATLDDHHGSLWVSSNNGVFRLSKQELADFAAGRISRIRATPFGVADGLRSAECNGGVQPSAWRSRGGTLFFPTVKGVAFIDPAHIRTNAVQPPARIEQVIADERAVPIGRAIRLAPGTHRLEVQFAGLSFTAPDRVRFRYRLEGFDREWIDAGTRRSAIYTNLGPATYRFAVMAGNSDDRWSREAATLDIEQLPFFHQTRAFTALCSLGAAALIWIFLLSWTRRVRAEYAGKLAERARIARELHDTVAQELVSVGMMLELAASVAESDSAASRRHIERAATISHESLHEVRRVLADLRAPALDGDDLPAALKTFAARSANGSSVRPTVVVHGAPRRLSTETENDLFRIAQEAITNALRHAGASRVEVELSYESSRVRLRVRDDGSGDGELDATARERFGIRGMKERAARMNAQLLVTSKVNEGTEVSVQVNV